MSSEQRPRRQPNVILIMTDDQGYGDLSCTGNPWLPTPHLDRFHDQSVRFTHFHVSPLCTPSRGAIMSGCNPLRNGAWATTWGRSMLRTDQATMADVFAHSGYATAMFGKWHLGDNYPYRPQDRGFQHVVAHKGGGVGQTPDFWGNSYFDDTYFHNGEPQAHQGYCTDVWFDEALAFIEANRERPFFCYLATNAPHAPYLVADRYKEPFLGNEEIPEPAFYGMIVNIDENMGRMVRALRDWGLEENTILIFMTDNGTSGGWQQDASGRWQGYNAGMRGKKGSYYDGGHRVPVFFRWPAGGYRGGRDIDELVTHMDLLPTFIDLCGLQTPEPLAFDGLNAAPLLRGETDRLPERCVYVQYRQWTDPPEKWVNAVMTSRWRLIEGRELYDIRADPGQTADLAEQHPEVVAQLRAAHEAWWDEVWPQLDEYCPISLGNDAENPTRLDAFDVLGDVAWNQTHIRSAVRSSGVWQVNVERAGEYTFRLQRWPEELGLPIDAALEGGGASIPVREARLKLGDVERSAPVAPGERAVTFRAPLEPGIGRLEAWFVREDGEMQGAYYVYVERV